MLVSQCCKTYISVEGHTTHYYVCLQCGKATDAVEQKRSIQHVDYCRTGHSQERND